MKNNFVKFLFKLAGIFVICSLFASFSPSLDGRAVVAEEGVLPAGNFAKTVGYLPGDTITVTNISGKTTVDILVIGALDPSEGVAILLSPEAAQAVGISKNSNCIVKLTKRTNQDERFFGAAMIAENGEEDSDLYGITKITQKEDEIVSGSGVPEYTEESEDEEEYSVEETEEDSVYEEDEYSDEENAEDFNDIEEEYIDEEIEQDFENIIPETKSENEITNEENI